MKYKLASIILASCLLIAVPPFTSTSQTSTRAAHSRREIAITFDDLPTAYGGSIKEMETLTNDLIASIKSNGVPAIGFVNEGKLYRFGEMDAAIGLLKRWLDAGYELGNHTFSHINNREASLAAYKEDVVRGETITRMLLQQKNMKLRYFRHPFLFTGPNAEYKAGLESFLAERGYLIAPVTIDNSDYIFAYVYSAAKARNDKAVMQQVTEAYIPYMEEMFDFFEMLSRDTLGREIKQILLLHANELNADHFGELARMMASRGYNFVPLGEALSDPAYRIADPPIAGGVSWIQRWRVAKGMKTRPEPDLPKFISEMFEKEQREK